MIKDNRYSIRKTKIAVGSVLIASFLAAGAILPSNNNIVRANETVMVPRAQNIYDSVENHWFEDNILYIQLKDNVEFKPGDYFEVKANKNFALSNSSEQLKILNEDTGEIIHVGSAGLTTETNENLYGKLFTEEANRMYSEGTFETFSQDKYLELLNKFDSFLNQETSLKITLNENINNLSKNRTIKVNLDLSEKSVYVTNPLRLSEGIRGHLNNYPELKAKLDEMVSNSYTREVTFNGNKLVDQTYKLSYNEKDDWFTDKVVYKTPIEDLKLTNGNYLSRGGLNGPVEWYDEEEDYITYLGNLTTEFIVHLSNESIGGAGYYKENYSINPNELVLSLTLKDTPIKIKENIPQEIEIALTGETSIRDTSTEFSLNNKIARLSTEDDTSMVNRNEIFIVERVGENQLLLKNKNQINIEKGSDSLSINNSFRLGEQISHSHFFELKEGWQDYVNYETKAIKHETEFKSILKGNESISTTTQGFVRTPDLGWGEHTKGTVKVRFEDEAGNAIPNKSERTLIDNQVWRTKYSINSAEETPAGYTYVGLKEGSKPLSGIAGNGERIVTLVFKKNVRYIPDPTIPTGEKVPNGDGTEIRVGTAPKVEKLPFNTTEEKDPTKPEGYREVKVPGKEGSITTPYTIDEQGNPVPGTPVRVEPVNEVVVVGTGKETPIPKGITYIKDDTKPVGTPNETTPGKDGVRNPDGTVKEEPVNDVVKVPASDKVEKTPISFTTEYRENPNLPAGEQKEVQAGKDGETVVTTPYTVDPKTGEVIPGTPVTTTTPAVVRIVEVGTKPTTEVVPHNKTTVEDPKKPLTYREVTTPGKDGEKTTTYTVDPKTGEVTSTEAIVPAVDEVTTVGTGPNKLVPAGVVYEADPELPFGETSTIPGKDGLQDVEGKVLEEPTPTIVKIGTKVADEVIPFEKITVKDPEKDIDYKEITTPGVEGKKTTTITVNPKTGEVEKVVDVTPPVTEVTTIGTKPIYTEEWIGDDFAGDKDNDPKVVDSVDIVEEWIEDPYVSDLPEVNNYTIVVNLDGVQISSTDYDMLTDVEFMNKLTSVQNELLNDGRNLTLDSLETNGNVATINLKSPDEYKEEWIGDPFAGDKDKDAEIIVSNDVVYDQEWIDDPYVTDHPEINNYTIIVSVDGITEQTLNFDGITEETFNEHLTAIKESVKQDPRKLIENGVSTNGNTITLNFKSPDEYKEEWIGDPFVGEKNKDAEHIVSVDKIIEDLKEEEPMPEKPKEETPVKEVPKVETPKAETPKAEEVKKEEKKLPNTGADDSSSMLAASAGASLIGFAALAHRRKRK